MVLPFSSHLLLEDLGNLSVMPPKLAIVALNLGKYAGPHSTVTHITSPTPTKLKAILEDGNTIAWQTSHMPTYILKRAAGGPVSVGHITTINSFYADMRLPVKSVDLTTMAETLLYKSDITIYKICEEAEELWILSPDQAKKAPSEATSRAGS